MNWQATAVLKGSISVSSTLAIKAGDTTQAAATHHDGTTGDSGAI
jgi:hypothetical protein